MIPESSARKFGEWIVTEKWTDKKAGMSSTETAVSFEQLVCDKLDQFCPVKEFKLSSQDKPFITSELKHIARMKNREYNKRGKTQKYKELENQFKSKYKIAAEKYLNKNLDELKETKPGQAYSILKKMGAQPGDCLDNNTFTLTSHEGLSDEESVECIAAHFAEISQEFPPLDVTTLPRQVQNKLQF